MDLPDAIKNAPELSLGLELFYCAFQDLMSCRTYGMSEGPIPFTAIADYCLAYDIEGEQWDDVMYHVRALDAAYLEYKRSLQPGK